MTATLESGFSITTNMGIVTKVIRMLGEGGQGQVFEVDYGGKRKALKWYFPKSLGTKPQKFYDNIVSNIDNGPPTDSFLWPQDITPWYKGTFGYIMDLRPDNYFEFGHYLLRKAKFNSFITVVDAALGILEGFRALHNRGYSYQDLNDGNFFIRPDTGDVLICDNDNVAPFDANLGIKGKCRYMAPEIVLGKNDPDKKSDRFSLAIILFELLCMQHPLEGRASTPPCMTPSLERKYYGSDALFIFDPQDDSNRPEPAVHGRNALIIWPCLPNYIKDLFYRAFSHESCSTGAKRPLEREWIDAFTHFRGEIIRCHCGNEIFVDSQKQLICDNCNETLAYPHRIQLANKEMIVAYPGNRIYRCQLGTCDEAMALNVQAEVVTHPKNHQLLGLKNTCADLAWTVSLPDGNKRSVHPGETAPIHDGYCIDMGINSIQILSLE